MSTPPVRWNGIERRKDFQDAWHLDKRVPIALIIAMAMQLGGFIWYAAKQEAALHRLRDDVTLMQSERREERAANAALRETLATLKETAMQQQRALERIERQLETITRRAALVP
jgi:Tfp pilus assembly protein PilO